MVGHGPIFISGQRETPGLNPMCPQANNHLRGSGGPNFDAKALGIPAKQENPEVGPDFLLVSIPLINQNKVPPQKSTTPRSMALLSFSNEPQPHAV